MPSAYLDNDMPSQTIDHHMLLFQSQCQDYLFSEFLHAPFYLAYQGLVQVSATLGKQIDGQILGCGAVDMIRERWIQGSCWRLNRKFRREGARCRIGLFRGKCGYCRGNFSSSARTRTVSGGLCRYLPGRGEAELTFEVPGG